MTTLKSNFSSNTFEIERDNAEGNVFVNFSKAAFPYASVSREEFAQAVRDLGFVVIDKTELPTVDSDGAVVFQTVDARGPGPHVRSADPWTAPAGLRSEAVALLALAAYLEANPPIDPKVEALAEMIRAVDAGHTTSESAKDIATRLLATGRIEIKEN